jgi:tRNA U34 5-carboxymethylaminomethyl modifying GTPase MnmE/TrmE
MIRKQWDSLALILSKSALEAKTLGVVTKSDQTTSKEIDAFIEGCKDLEISSWSVTSAFSGSGIPEAIERIIHYCEKWTHRDQGEILLTRLDHLNSVLAALEHLQRALIAPEIDLFASDIRQALYSLGPLIGETVPDDILGKIFSNFCIGK